MNPLQSNFGLIKLINFLVDFVKNTYCPGNVNKKSLLLLFWVIWSKASAAHPCLPAKHLQMCPCCSLGAGKWPPAALAAPSAPPPAHLWTSSSVNDETSTSQADIWNCGWSWIPFYLRGQGSQGCPLSVGERKHTLGAQIQRVPWRSRGPRRSWRGFLPWTLVWTGLTAAPPPPKSRFSPRPSDHASCHSSHTSQTPVFSFVFSAAMRTRRRGTRRECVRSARPGKLSLSRQQCPLFARSLKKARCP